MEGDPHYAKLQENINIRKRTSVVVSCDIDRFEDLGEQVEAEENN